MSGGKFLYPIIQVFKYLFFLGNNFYNSFHNSKIAYSMEIYFVQTNIYAIYIYINIFIYLSLKVHHLILK